MKYKLSAYVTVSACTVVEADSLADAIKIAERRRVVLSTGHDGADCEEDWVIEDADGEATDIQEETP